jgi:hypothetical protein
MGVGVGVMTVVVSGIVIPLVRGDGEREARFTDRIGF